MKYIGNKTRLLGFIENSLRSFGAPISGVFCDLFSGTASVAEHFKKKGFEVISNDFMAYSYAIQKAYVEAPSVPNFLRLTGELPRNRDLLGPEVVIEYLNNLAGRPGYFWDNFGDGGSAGRKYFTKENAQLVDAIREQIETWSCDGLVDEQEKFYLLALLIDAADHVANMSGTYGAYLKIWRSVALKRLRLVFRPVVPSTKRNKSYMVKAEDLVGRISGDILYLDPPYNSRQYAANFHVLESLVVWDKQTLSGKTGLRDYSSQKSGFCSRKTAADSLRAVMFNASFDVVALSYNNEGIISHQEITEILQSVGDTSVYSTTYRRFRTERDHEHRRYRDVDDKTLEYLFCVRKFA
jgi:adenine-specific DNA-methyltransferase